MIGPKGDKRAAKIPAATRRALRRRSEGVCEGCGIRKATEAHHRKFLSRGGMHDLSNLMALCGWGSHTGCHGAAHGANPPEGWALPSGDSKPSNEPVMYRGHRVLIDDLGNVETDYRVVF